jgi:nucleotide-binding universal stress UspA family protein
MALKDITVHLHRNPGATAHFMAAIDLARRHQACLRGLYAISHPYYLPNSNLDRDYDEVRTFFLNAAAKSHVQAEWLLVDWQVVGVPLSDIIAVHAYHTDVLIVGQPVPGSYSRREELLLPQRLILETGRPVVVLPSDGNTYRFGEKIMVAWKRGRESARAIHDALPLLEKASEVTIVAVVSGQAQRDWETDGLSALQEHLDRHGIQTSTSVLDSGSSSVADVLLHQVGELGADLLVVGGYTPASRISRGPNLSRDLISRTPVPILFSH